MEVPGGDMLCASDATPGAHWLRRHAAALGYVIAAIAVWLGWLLTRSRSLVEPDQGLGYWLGIAGASLMATLLLYPLRKRLRLMRMLGATRHWFRMHMVLGVVGPVLILYHCNFQFGSLNSNVALICTLLVAGSGLIGRYIYAKIHVDLDGHRATLRELTARAQISAEEKTWASAFAPQLLERLTAFDDLVLAPPSSLAASLSLPLKLSLQTRWRYAGLIWLTRRQLLIQARKSAVIRAERKRLQRVMNRFIGQHLRRVRRVAEYASYERLFSLWHVFHLPFFYMLVLTALLHVLAVHMY